MIGIIAFIYIFDDTIKMESEFKTNEILAALSSKNRAKDYSLLISEISITMQDNKDTDNLLLCTGERDTELVSAIAEELGKKEI